MKICDGKFEFLETDKRLCATEEGFYIVWIQHERKRSVVNGELMIKEMGPEVKINQSLQTELV